MKMNDSCQKPTGEKCPWPTVYLISGSTASSLLFTPLGLKHFSHIWRECSFSLDLDKEIILYMSVLLHSENHTTASNSIVSVNLFSQLSWLSQVLGAVLQDFLQKTRQQTSGEISARQWLHPTSSLRRGSFEPDSVCEEWQVEAAMETKSKQCHR